MPGTSTGLTGFGTAGYGVGPRLSTTGSPICTPDWLALREPADAAARATELVDLLVPHLGDGRVVVRDLGCGTGSMGRWLANRIPNPQHWILHDRDPEVLARASLSLPAHVTTQTSPGDIADLDAAQLAGTSLVTASALLDMMTAAEVEGLAEACSRAGCPTLLTLSVVGTVLFSPADHQLDGTFAAAFNAHQRRSVGGRTLLGPDAVVTAARAFRRRGVRVSIASSPWRLGPDDAGLREEWLRGWLSAACEQRPELRKAAGPYLRRRLENPDLRVVLGHADLLAIPVGAS
jgi:hypothetical protein